MTESKKSRIVESLTNILLKNNKKLDNDSRKRLEEEIKEVISEMEALKNNYHFASGDMIDYYSYQILAAEMKFRYLNRKLRKIEASNY